jgi:hybrid cluster-associated redox disulfide protein
MENQVTPELKVEETLKRWPETIPVFLKYHMACVGCSMSSFETISGAAEIYQLPVKTFIEELQQAISTR